MFTFVIWVVGLSIMGGMAVVDWNIMLAAFEKHWLLGLLCIAASLIGWLILYSLVF